MKTKTKGGIKLKLERLVKKAQKGDDKAYLMLFQQYETDIYRMAYVYVKNKDDALDLVQEVAYQSFKKISTLKKSTRSNCSQITTANYSFQSSTSRKCPFLKFYKSFRKNNLF